MSSAGADSKESSSKWSNPFKKQGNKVADAKPTSNDESHKQVASNSSTNDKADKKDGKKRNLPPLNVPYFPTSSFLGRL
ncbi:hypothetical protein MPTK1_2g18620 [Marchantia polymorpha subsp. ruderalis]|uniref:Uncharacterized protein n=1 Tax=Marchantia polymorpha TaxID=3197 RepID=A0A2R6W723_MARPO|nr:hypothetical protein MARPO_0137s0019 [Marchantia polymorpha]BBN02844.1 hypothetical protein Mp_2g18620 [Marchantia polymorpha subsp. ruderalis]|eukprot:PTQ29651.1 hypothetical protein MARPO_0137s0019 [Marchantia polymorpha]